jgi:Uma2 family endonuclease
MVVKKKLITAEELAALPGDEAKPYELVNGVLVERDRMMAVTQKPTTAEELALLHDDDAKRYELVEGVLIEVSPSNQIHTALAAELARLLGNYVVEHDLGEVSGEIGGYLLQRNPDIVRAPDVGFISKAKLTTEIDSAYYPFAPDLAVEIVSPGDTATEVYDKVVEYFKAGTQLVWFVYPNSKTVHIYTSTTSVAILTVDDVLDGMNVLPGLKLPVGDVFKRMRSIPQETTNSEKE